MTCVTGQPWSPSEIQLVRAAYASGGIKAARAALPHRSDSSIYHRAHRIGESRKRRWTRNEKAKLREMWGVDPIPVIAQELNRTPGTIYWRACRMGLEFGTPQGYELLSHAAERCGYKSDQLRRILKWAGVSITPHYGRLGSVSDHGRRYVEIGAADEAVERWHKTETVECAARRHGICGTTMLRWLEEAGVEASRASRKKKANHRVLSAEVDRIVAERRALEAGSETLVQAAKRVGVKAATLSIWMRAVGIEPNGRVFKIAPAAVDRVVAERLARPTCRAKGRAK